MTGPEHYSEGQERMRASDYQRQEGFDGDLTTAMHEAAMAQAHFAAALVALLAQHLDQYNADWQQAVGW
jgi:hypothetical protein